MRRLLSITLLLMFGLPLVSPLFALSASADSNLPACCRRNGVHHCEMAADRVARLSVEQSSATVQAKCTMYPAPAASFHVQPLLPGESDLFFAGLLTHPSNRPQVEAWARFALAGARHKRGPPADLS